MQHLFAIFLAISLATILVPGKFLGLFTLKSGPEPEKTARFAQQLTNCRLGARLCQKLDSTRCFNRPIRAVFFDLRKYPENV
jgi:hypothetical protein